jgi:hypothetical protein
MRVALAIALVLASMPLHAAVAGTATVDVAASDAPRFDGRSPASFAASRTTIEAEMGDAAKLGFHMKLAQVRAKLAEQRGRPLTDAEFAHSLDGKTLADLDALADAAPTQITIDIETSDDT